MTITILICVHSVTSTNDKLLVDALKSLENQTYKDFDVLIVFDECWQHTKLRVENTQFNLNLKFLEKEKKEGLAFAKNFGLKHINSEWIGFLDADDLYMPKKLEKQIQYIKNNNVDFLGTLALNRKNINDKNYTNSCIQSNKFETHEQLKNILFTENVLTHGSMLIKKSALDDLGDYHHVIGKEDWDLWKRALNKGYKFYQLQERLYVWTFGTSVTR